MQSGRYAFDGKRKPNAEMLRDELSMQCYCKWRDIVNMVIGDTVCTQWVKFNSGNCHRRRLKGERPPSSEMGSVKSLSSIGLRVGRRWILAYCTIGPTMSESAIAGNLSGSFGSFKMGSVDDDCVSPRA